MSKASTVVKGLSLLGNSLREAGVVGRILLVGSQTAAQRAPYNRTLMALQKDRFQCAQLLCQTTEAQVTNVDAGVLMAQTTGCGAVVAVGGGSMIDVGKAIGSVLSNGGQIGDYSARESSYNRKYIVKDSYPVVVVPTALGSGAETSDTVVTLNVADEKACVLKNERLQPVAVLVDPEVLKELPVSIQNCMTVSNFSRSLDAFLNTAEDLEGESDGGKFVQTLAALEASLKDLENQESLLGEGERGVASVDTFIETKYNASFNGGQITSIHGLGISARLAQTLCGMFSLPYAAVNAALFLPLLKARISHYAEKQRGAEVMARLENVARMVCRDNAASVEDFVRKLESTYSVLGIKSLKDLEMSKEDADVAVSLIFAEEDLDTVQEMGREKLVTLLTEG